MSNWVVSEFKEKILKGQVVPADLKVIIENQCCLDVLEEQLEFELIKHGRVEEEIAHAYLSEEERKNIDIKANIFAINKVFEYITFFAEAENGMLLGYWHGEENLNILEAPLVGYDTEGQFKLFDGNQIIESLAMEWTGEDEDEYEEIQDSFIECNIQVGSLDSVSKIKTKSNPSDMYNKLFFSKKEELKSEQK